MKLEVKVKALEKLVEYTASGIGSITRSILATWFAQREAQAKEISARAEANILQIRAEAHTRARETLFSEEVSLAGELNIEKSIDQRLLFQEQKRQLNIESVVRKTAEQLGDSNVPDTEPDHDWTARFFNDIQDVSSEEMQSLWAKILAGEVERKGSTSIRTLGILKSMDQITARRFRGFCSACVFLSLDGTTLLDARVPSLGGNAGSSSLRDYGLDFDALNHLNEYGLIISNYNSWYDYRMCIGFGNPPRLTHVPFRFQGRHWGLLPAGDLAPGKEFRLRGVALTGSGRELSGIVGMEKMDDFSKALSDFFRKNNLQMEHAE